MLFALRFLDSARLPGCRRPAFVWFLFLTVLAGCSSSDPAVVLIGDWAGDMSATGNAIRAMKLKNDDPGASSSDVMQAARALGEIGVTFAEDKTFELIWQGKTKIGTWSVDNERNEVLLDFNPEPVDPKDPVQDPAADVAAQDNSAAENPVPDKAAPAPPEVPKRTQWVARLDVSALELELFTFDQTTLDYVKQINDAGKEKTKIKGMRLTKQ